MSISMENQFPRVVPTVQLTEMEVIYTFLKIYEKASHYFEQICAKMLRADKLLIKMNQVLEMVVK